MDALNQHTILTINQAGWETVAPKFYGATALPDYGPFAPSEDQIHLLGNVSGQRVLELGCGSGHSLVYLAQQGATEVWGLDLAATQIAAATELLHARGIAAHLFTSPMEHNPGIPTNYFDVVISIYALGWTADLTRTLAHVAAYLKANGRFVFSWEHPLHHCLSYADGHFIVTQSYQTEGPRLAESWLGVPIVRHARKLSTFLNTLLDQGFVVERLLEPEFAVDGPPAHDDPAAYYSMARASLVPATFIVCARKP